MSKQHSHKINPEVYLIRTDADAIRIRESQIGSGLRMQTVAERAGVFWSKVDKSDPTGCWNWMGYIEKRNPYGKFDWWSRRRSAHRFAWIWANGYDPVGLEVCHHCDNKKCVNPSHLFVGTHKENMDDMWQKGKGPPIPVHAILKPEQVIKIRSMWIPRVKTMKQIAEELGLYYKTVESALRSWKHIPWIKNAISLQ